MHRGSVSRKSTVETLPYHQKRTIIVVQLIRCVQVHPRMPRLKIIRRRPNHKPAVSRDHIIWTVAPRGLVVATTVGACIQGFFLRERKAQIVKKNVIGCTKHRSKWATSRQQGTVMQEKESIDIYPKHKKRGRSGAWHFTRNAKPQLFGSVAANKTVLYIRSV